MKWDFVNLSTSLSFLLLFLIIVIVNLKIYFCLYFQTICTFYFFHNFLDDIINIPEKMPATGTFTGWMISFNLNSIIPNFISHHRHRGKIVYVNAIKIIHQHRQFVKQNFTLHPETRKRREKMRQSTRKLMGNWIKINKKSIKVRWKSFFIVFFFNIKRSKHVECCDESKSTRSSNSIITWIAFMERRDLADSPQC